jgi:hypothetical protein
MAVMKERHVRAIAVLGGLLAACHPEERQRPSDPKAVSACMAAQHGNDNYSMVTKCEPLGRQTTLHGTWFVGSEMSVFRKGYTGVPADLGTIQDQSELVVPTALDQTAHAKDSKGPSAYQVSFLGRESALPWTRAVKLVVADRVLSLRRVPMAASVSKPQR